jgi:hypothetical protein
VSSVLDRLPRRPILTEVAIASANRGKVGGPAGLAQADDEGPHGAGPTRWSLGADPVDAGNCDATSRVWRIDDRSYVFELRTSSIAVGDEYCGGEARSGVLVGCILDDHGY